MADRDRATMDALLRRVAAGDLSPDEALRLLDRPPESTGGDGGADRETGDRLTGQQVTGQQVTGVRVATSYRAVRVVGDPAVAQLHVLGEHTVRQEGTTLVVSTTGPVDDDGEPQDRFALPGLGRFSFSDLPRTLAWARSWREHELTVRVNPGLALDLDVTGGEIKVSGAPAGFRAHLVASSLRADGLAGPLDVEAYSSSVKLTAVPTSASRLQAESSSVRLFLDRGADVTIRASNRMGRLVLPFRPTSTLPFEGETSQTTVGDGRYPLELEAVMSSVTVATDTWSDATGAGAGSGSAGASR